MNENHLVLSKEGLAQIKAELEELRARREAVIGRIRTSKEFGDISENSEYEDAKNEQAFLEGRIQELESLFRRAKLVKEIPKDGKVQFGSKVAVLGSSKEVFEIVGSTEAEPEAGKISADSPLGQALLGRQAGETVEVETPSGTQKYKIARVS